MIPLWNGTRDGSCKTVRLLIVVDFRFEEIQNKLSPFLKSVGFNPKNDITYIPCSGLHGSFLKERPAAGAGDWYT
jgi:translation elongation factor EF-1alpha